MLYENTYNIRFADWLIIVSVLALHLVLTLIRIAIILFLLSQFLLVFHRLILLNLSLFRDFFGHLKINSFNQLSSRCNILGLNSLFTFS